jgi:hypothetical protein
MMQETHNVSKAKLCGIWADLHFEQFKHWIAASCS